MKIAVFHELPVGGALRAVKELSKELKTRHTVDLFYVAKRNDNSNEKYFSNIKFYKFKPRIWKGKNWRVRLYKDTIELFNLYKLHEKIYKDIKKGNYDVVFIHASEYTQSPFLLRFPLKNKVFYLHDPHYRMLYEPVLGMKKVDVLHSNYEKLNRLLRKIIDDKNVRSADLILANSKYTKHAFKKTYGLESKLGYLGVDSMFFKPKKVEKKYDVLYIGSREKVDGLYLLEEAISLIDKPLKLRLILKEDEWINSDVKLRDLYRSSRIVVCLAHDEPLGLVALEAMSCGIPVIAVNEGGHRETIVNNKSGFLIQRNSHKFANKILELIENDKLRLKFGEAARKNIENDWTWQKITLQIEKRLMELINSH